MRWKRKATGPQESRRERASASSPPMVKHSKEAFTSADAREIGRRSRPIHQSVGGCGRNHLLMVKASKSFSQAARATLRFPQSKTASPHADEHTKSCMARSHPIPVHQPLGGQRPDNSRLGHTFFATKWLDIPDLSCILGVGNLILR